MRRNPRSVIALILGCLLLIGFAALERAPQQHDPLPPSAHAAHRPTRSG